MDHKTDIFSQLTKSQTALLKRSAQERKYSKGELIFSKGDENIAIWLIKKGRVHLQNISYDGKAMTSCVMTEGDTFCCLPALDDKPYPVDALVAEPSVILRIPAQVFRKLMQENPVFSRQVMCTFCDRLRQLEGRGCQAMDPAEFRVARLLLALGEKFKNEIPLTRQEMAEIAGLTVETTIRILSRMKKEGLIRSIRKKLELVSPEKLRELVKE